jgi:uncharacterized phage protein (TIGR01671 family)
MREIKFRGKNINGKWYFGYFSQDRDGAFILKETHVIQAIPETVGQFTGLKDRNGKEIYEGDILKASIRNKDMLFEVHYNVNRCMWEAKHKEIGETMALQNIFFRHSETEVIGNIHELLTQK